MIRALIGKIVLVSAMTLLLISGFVRVAHAGPIGGVGTVLSYQLATNGRDYSVGSPLAIRAGYHFGLFDVYGEYTYTIEKPSGTEFVKVGLQDHGFLVWGRMGDRTATTFKPFAALGLGAHQQTVKTDFDGAQSRDAGTLEGVAAAAGGLLVRLQQNVDFTVEGRVSSAASYQPNPLIGLGAFLGIVY